MAAPFGETNASNEGYSTRLPRLMSGNFNDSFPVNAVCIWWIECLLLLTTSSLWPALALYSFTWLLRSCFLYSLARCSSSFSCYSILLSILSSSFDFARSMSSAKPSASAKMVSNTFAEGEGASLDLWSCRRLLPSGDGKNVTLPTTSGATLKNGLCAFLWS